MNRTKGRKKAILEEKLTDQELIKITGGETFATTGYAKYGDEPDARIMYGVFPDPDPPIYYPMYGVKPPVLIRPYPIYIRLPIVIKEC